MQKAHWGSVKLQGSYSYIISNIAIHFQKLQGNYTFPQYFAKMTEVMSKILQPEQNFQEAYIIYPR